MNFEEYMNCQNSDDMEWEEGYEYNEGYVECGCPCTEMPPKPVDPNKCLEDTVDNSCISVCKPTHRPVPKMGKVEAYSYLGCVDGEPISNVPFNLYKIENGCEKLVASKKTDKCGRVEFNCLENGLYRIQQVVDECVFECPEYYPGREFCITDKTKCQKIYVINNLRQIDKCLQRMIDKAAEDAVKRVLCRCKCRGC